MISFCEVFILMVATLTLINSSHILVILICQQGHTASLIQTSTALLKSNNQHFITFIIPESCPNKLTQIINDKDIDSNSYQIVYSQKYEWFSKQQMMEQTLIKVFTNVPKAAYRTFPRTHYLISKLNIQSFNKQLYPDFNPDEFNDINSDLLTKYNNVSTLQLSTKIGLVISEFFDVFTPGLCKIFDIPLLIRVVPLIPFQMESSLYYQSVLPGIGFPIYPFNHYGHKIQNILASIRFHILTIYTAFIHYNPTAKLHGLPTCNTVPGAFDDAVLFHFLGSPFTVSYAVPSNVKQFGFLLNAPNIDDAKQQYQTLYEWIDINIATIENMPIILMSMGSVIFVDEQFVNNIFDIFYDLAVKQHKVRILWALRQIEDLTQLQTLENNEYFKIYQWIPQMEILHHDKIKLFITHAGSNGIHEALHALKPMIVIPQKNDQLWNAMRVQNLKCGRIVDGNVVNTTLKDTINTMLFVNSSFYQKNVKLVHEMLIDLNGEMDDFVDFINLIAKYGIKKLIFTDGLESASLDWYHKTVIDVYIIGVVFILIIFALFRCVFICCCSRNKSKTHPKIKQQ